jgi:hypothetical protein
LYHKDLYQQKWPKTTFIGRGSQGNHSGHKRLFVKALIREKIHANTLQLPYWYHHWLSSQVILLTHLIEFKPQLALAAAQPP